MYRETQYSNILIIDPEWRIPVVYVNSFGNTCTRMRQTPLSSYVVKNNGRQNIMQ